MISIRKYLSNMPGKHEIDELQKQPYWALHAYFGNQKSEQFLYRPGKALRISGGSGLRFQDNWYKKVLRLSALRTGRLYPPGIITGIYLC